MTEGRILNRWMVVAGAVLIQLCLGAIYAWSVFTKPLVEAPGLVPSAIASISNRY
mgnify:CR=1 FL=1